MITNQEFINAIFGDDAQWAHVTDFPYDPTGIPDDKRLFAWKGDYNCRYRMSPQTNQYFTISTFYADDQQQARRRKSLFRQTHCVVLDDVREKLSEEAAARLPVPSWILETSRNSFQWGYILNEPCTIASKIDNLNDGLIASELAPDGKDPGQRGVTRYVRLPEGINNKSSKLIDGQPWQCRMTHWQPFNRVTLEQLAAPFNVNLDAVRRDARVDGAADVPDHPLLNTGLITVKEVRSDGRFDITCPWVHEHTDQDDSGSAIFTNEDGSMGFKCHHGNCQDKTGRDLMRWIEAKKPGFSTQYKSWSMFREFTTVADINFFGNTAPVSFMSPPVTQQPVQAQPVEVLTPEPDLSIDGLRAVFNDVQRELPGSTERRNKVQAFLKVIDDLPEIDRREWHDQIRSTMGWSKPDFAAIIKDLRTRWYETDTDTGFCDGVFYVSELNQFYNWESRIFMSPEAFQNTYSHEDPDAKKNALMEERVLKVDRLDYAPHQPRTFHDGRRLYGNTWYEGDVEYGIEGDISPWMNHWDAMGWGEHRDHIMKFMAYTILKPERKINHMVIMGGREGSGKDYLLYPFMKAMGHHSRVISGDELLHDFNDFVLGVKYLHINEVDLGSRAEAKVVANKLKPYAAAPPESLRVNQKGIKQIEVRNIVNSVMTTNSQTPIATEGHTRRFYAIWSDLSVRDDRGDMTEEWGDYWGQCWDWMKAGGWHHVVWYLRNCVDISMFDPGKAPPVTDFLEDIHEASKSPAQQTVEKFIRSKSRGFSRDLLTASEIAEMIRGAAMDVNMSSWIMTDPKWFSAVNVGRVMRDMPTVDQVRARHMGDEKRLWVVRNRQKYRQMKSGDLYMEYERQVQEMRGGPKLKTVSGVDVDKQ